MHIEFEAVRYKNFLSTGNDFLEVNLSASGKTLVVGRNGHGKSTLLDAVYFALFGRPFRNINKGKLVNSINKKQCVVELNFKVGSNQYLVRRGIKPDVFEVYQDEVLIDQNASVRDDQKQFEKNILGGLTPNVFRQLVVLGSANYVPFMQLTTAQRREVIENLLDIKVFSVMNSLLKDNVSENKRNIQTNQRDVDNVDSLITAQEEQLRLSNEGQQEKKDKLEAEIQLKIAEQNRLSDLFLELKEPSEYDFSQEQKVIDKSLKLRDFKSKIVAKIQGFSSIVSFFENHDTCPTCSQTITEELAQQKTKENQTEIDKLKDGMGQIEIEQKKTNDRLQELKNEKDENSKRKSAIDNNTRAVAEIEREIRSLRRMQENITEVQQQPIIDAIESLKDKKRERQAVLKSLMEDKEICSLIVPMLKDGGVKAKVIQRYIPVINQHINHYLEALDFFAQFTLDEEFNEKILSRHRDDFEYNSFSEGEKLRIDIAILFTWRDVMKMRNTITTNLLIMDEILDRSIDQQGADEFLKLLNEVSSSSNVFVISHRGAELAEKFNRVLKFEKNGNYTTLVNE